jgi:alkanesulfonate monooxygenase SsuD/methylene tetrahydromethanopterin reductase-like flavin-dependent oxidoreductase (luciferase family)
MWQHAEAPAQLRSVQRGHLMAQRDTGRAKRADPAGQQHRSRTSTRLRLRNAPLSRLAANVDRLSSGRFIFGVGVGWAKQEFEALGVPFERRGAMSNDYLAAMRTAWTSDPASYAGPFVSLRDVHTGPRLVRSPHPPIWVGGARDAALRRAVRLGDAWHPVRMRIPWLRDTGLSKLREIADKEGRPHRGRGEPRPGSGRPRGARHARGELRAPRHVHGRCGGRAPPRDRVAHARPARRAGAGSSEGDPALTQRRSSQSNHTG